jgi:two-component system chemotaxis response regulator CheY
MKTPKILVVDDAAFMRNLIGNTIKEIGYSDLYYAGDGLEAVAKAREILPDFVTLDISMPNLNGVDAVAKILEVSPASKIIMITAVSGQHAIKDAIKSGAVDFIKKPFSREEIENVLKKHMN